jgi:DNA-binding IclR family transcriptional regulator
MIRWNLPPDRQDRGLAPCPRISTQAAINPVCGHALPRAFDVLEYFRTRRRAAQTHQDGRALGIPNSSADDLLNVMVAKGYLSYIAGSKYYTPSYGLLRMAEDLVERFSALESIGNIEHQLREGQTVIVTSQEASMFRIVSVAMGGGFKPQPINNGLAPLARFNERRGWVPTSNFAGALLAAHSDVEIVDILSKLDEPRCLTNFHPLLEQVRAIRKRGSAECELRPRAGVGPIASIAKSLNCSEEMPAIAIGCVGHTEEMGVGESISMGVSLRRSDGGAPRLSV